MNNEIKEILKDDDELIVVYKDNSTRTFDTLTIDVIDYITNLQQKYEKALELLRDFDLPCETDNFNIECSDFCAINCGNDEEQFKKCWDKFIEWKLNKNEVR